MRLSIGLLGAALLMLIQVASCALKLPKTSIPLKYELTLDFSVSGSRTIKGNVKIDIKIVEDTESIVLNSRAVAVNNVKVTESGTELENTFNLQPENEFLVINVTSRPLLTNDTLKLEIDFSGSLQTNSTKGIYRTSYKLNNSTTRYLVATQFAEREARSAFVCYDESEYKATFNLIVTCEKAYTVLTVSDGSKTPKDDVLATSLFLRGTPLISVESFGFLITEFEFNTLAGSVAQSFYTKAGDKNLTNFALNNADKFLNELQSYLTYPHELTKLLHAAIPDSSEETASSFRVIRYNTKDVYGDESSNHVTTLRILQTVANAVSHQYFGNIVTHKSKEFSWLTEGFANLFEELLIDTVHPEIRIQDFFNLQKLQNALKYDATNDTHPLTFDDEKLSPEIVRHKSASVLRMFKSAVGDEAFHSALESYFAVNHHDVVTAENLYQSFEDAIGTDLGFSFADAFKTWELQAGYPVISITLAKNGRSFAVTQKAFSEQKSDEADSRAWYIPLTFTTAGQADFDNVTVTDWFSNDKASVLVNAPDDFEATQWFIFNKQQLGFYRVNYDLPNWNALTNVLNSNDFDKIHVLNRAQLLDDSLAFATGGYLDFDTFFGILAYLERETEYTPWVVAERFISKLYATFGPTNEVSDLVRHLSGRFYDRFSLVTTTPVATEIYERHGQELAVTLACNANNENCISDSLTLLNQFLNERRDLPKGLESLIFCNGLKRSAAQEQWNATWQIMQNDADENEKALLIEALACTEDEAVLESYLHTIIEDEVNYSVAERKAVLSAVLKNPAGMQAVCNLLLEAQILVLVKLDLDMRLLPVLDEMASSVKTEEQRRVFNDYLNDPENGVIEDDKAIVNETIEISLKERSDPKNIEIFEIVEKFVERLNDETTTVTNALTTSILSTVEVTTTEREITTTTSAATTGQQLTTTELLTTISQTTELPTSTTASSSQLTTTSTGIPSTSTVSTTSQTPMTTSQTTKPSVLSTASTKTTQVSSTSSSTVSQTPTTTVSQTNAQETPTQAANLTTTTPSATSPQPATESTTQGSSSTTSSVILIASLMLLVSIRN